MALKAYKYRIYPNKGQAEQIARSIGCARFIYNLYVAWWNENNGKDKDGSWKKLPKLPLVTDFSHCEEYAFLKEADSDALSAARTNFQMSMKNYFDSRTGKRKGRKSGKPTFKSKHRSKWAYKTQCRKDSIRFDGDGKHVRLPKLGWVKAVMHRPIEGEIKSVNVEKKRSGRYYISVLVEYEPIPYDSYRIQKPKSEQRVVGLDMSLESFAVSSNPDDTIPKYDRLYRLYERRLKRLARRKDRKQNGSRNREKACVRLAREHEKIANRRREHCIQAALYFTTRYDVVVIETLDMQAMSRGLRLGKSVHDLGWGEFRQWLKLEADRHFCTVVEADRWFASSKLCNHCGSRNSQLRLSDREWVCGECGTVIDRDYNAACNLRDYYMKDLDTAATAGIYGCGDGTSTLSVNTDTASTVSEAASPSL